VFFRFKLLPWNWPWRIVTLLLGCAILAIFVALLNTLTPSGRIAVIGRVVEVTPNVSGTVTSIPVEPNVLVKAGTVLFQIDPAPYDAKVKQLRAAVAEARQKVEQLKAQVDLAVADVKGLGSQLDYAEKRRDDVEKLARTASSDARRPLPTRTSRSISRHSGRILASDGQCRAQCGGTGIRSGSTYRLLIFRRRSYKSPRLARPHHGAACPLAQS
jgi:multidrug efflux pump subunit AcrA (membrane-fusion protein)